MPPVTPSADKSLDGAERREAAGRPTPLRKIRIQRGLTQKRLAELCGMHRNSIRKIETGLTREIAAENADALSAALDIPVGDLGLHVRTTAGAASIRLRRLTLEQRQIIDELLSLPAEDYALLRASIERLRERRSKRRARKGPR